LHWSLIIRIIPHQGLNTKNDPGESISTFNYRLLQRNLIIRVIPHTAMYLFVLIRSPKLPFFSSNWVLKESDMKSKWRQDFKAQCLESNMKYKRLLIRMCQDFLNLGFAVLQCKLCMKCNLRWCKIKKVVSWHLIIHICICVFIYKH